jgi:hypothetical protein
MSDANGQKKLNTFLIDDREIDIRDGETIFRAARRLGIKLPHLCYSPKPGYRPDGNCRVCMVEIEGERVLAAAKRPGTAGCWWPSLRVDERRGSQNLLLPAQARSSKYAQIAQRGEQETQRSRQIQPVCSVGHICAF